MLLGAMGASAQEERGEALRSAAREGDTARIEQLLAAGVPVDAPNRYGATALFFAAERGHLEVVRQLAERGAALGIVDRFYQMTALSRAAGSGHRDVVLFLLERGAPGAGALLVRSARTGDEEILRAVLANGNFDEDALAAAREAAASEEITAFLRDQTAQAVAAPELTDEARRQLAGRYWNETAEQGVLVTAEPGTLRARHFERETGSEEDRFSGPATVLTARGGPRSFVAGEGGRHYAFPGRGGMVERLIVESGGETAVFQPEGESESRAAPREAAEAPLATGAGADPLVPLRTRPWPQFRGPGGSGIADEQGVPLRWNTTDGVGIAWEAPLAGLGVSSPIIWEDRVFVVVAASVTEDKEFRIGLYGDVAPVENDSEYLFELRALDLASGDPVWTRELRRGIPLTRRHTKSSQANATPVTDGQRIVTLLGSMGVLLCHDFEGNLLWEREVGVLNSGWFYDPDFEWGHASSPVIHGGAVIVLADIHGDAFLGAFDLDTGEPRWRAVRDEVSTFSTPLVHDVGGTAEVVVNGTVIRGYDAATGTERWRLGPNSEIPIGVPLLGDGLLFVQAGYPPIRPIYAIRPGMEGDLTLPSGEDSSEAIAWSKNRGGVYIPSPLFYRGVLYLNANNGRLSAYDGETGERLYRARIGGVGGSYAASPIAADGRLYFTTEEGDTFVVRAGRDYELLARNTVDRIVMASPAASGGVLVIRAIDRLFGITR
jgi:outer membrane protein assembly factor BamB